MHGAILVGTYHKTGTVWLLCVFRELARKLSVPFYDVSSDFMPSEEHWRKRSVRSGRSGFPALFSTAIAASFPGPSTPDGSRGSG